MTGDDAVPGLVCGQPAGRKLIVENNTEKRAVNFQPAVVVNKSQFPEAIHKKTHSRAGCADHFRQALLADLRNHGLWYTVFTKMSEHKKHSGQSLFTRIEELVDQILFVADIAREQIRDEKVGQLVFPMKNIHHGFLVDSHHSTICHCRCRTHTERLASQRTFAEKTPLAQYADRRFLAGLRDHSEFYLACLQIEHCVCSIS